MINLLADVVYVLVPIDLGDESSEGWGIYLEPFNKEEDYEPL